VPAGEPESPGLGTHRPKPTLPPWDPLNLTLSRGQPPLTGALEPWEPKGGGSVAMASDKRRGLPEAVSPTPSCHVYTSMYDCVCYHVHTYIRRLQVHPLAAGPLSGPASASEAQCTLKS
jgi:hypothetical protein